MAVEVIHDRKICIGCGACAVVCPKYWEMNDDGKADLKNSRKKGDLDVLILDEPDGNQEAAESCPVSCIRVKIKNDDLNLKDSNEK